MLQQTSLKYVQCSMKKIITESKILNKTAKVAAFCLKRIQSILNKRDLGACAINIDVCLHCMKGQIMETNNTRIDLKIDVTYRNMREEDIEALTPIIKAAVDDDTRIHTELEEDGPFGYDNGALLKS